MNSSPTVTEILSTLDSLRATVRDFAAREERLASEFHSRSAAEQKQFETASTAASDQAAAAIAAAQADYDASVTRIESRFASRKTRLNRAHINARKKVLDLITDFEGKDRYRVQEGTLAAEKRRDAEIAHAAGVLEEFQHRAVETRDALARLEQSAVSSFGGYKRFRRLLAPGRQWRDPDLSGDENRLHEEAERLQEKTAAELDRFRGRLIPQTFRCLPLWLFAFVLLGFAISVPILQHFGIHAFSVNHAAAAAAGFALVLILYVVGGTSSAPAAESIAGNLARARRLLETAFQKAEARLLSDQERLKGEFDATVQSLNQQWKKGVKAALDQRGTLPAAVDEQARRTGVKLAEAHRRALERLEQEHKLTAARLNHAAATETQLITTTHNERISRLNSERESRWTALAAEWTSAVGPAFQFIRELNERAQRDFPGWDIGEWKDWTPPGEFKNAARFGTLEIDIARFAESLPKDPRLALPGPEKFTVPLSLVYPENGSLLLEASKTGHDEAAAAINNVVFRLLSTVPPGKLSFTVFDPVGLGQNFAGLMHLADYEEGHINSRIWTQQNQFEEKLAELNEHMEKVIQMYLRNEYATIAEYNAQAGSIAEKYHFLVIASFPVNFSDTAARRLRNIATSGARCGVYTLIHWDQRNPLPPGFVPDELRQNSVVLARGDNGFTLSNWKRPGARLTLDAPPSAEFATRFLHQIGAISKDSNRVEVPFEQVAPAEAEFWSVDTSEELRVPIGRSGATKLQYLEIGRGTRQHTLIAGKTGSGKSTLFHVIITNLALWCSPEQVEFYLVDFKKGVEFKGYATRRLPHAKVVAIESDRDFGLSVLQRVDAELRRRGDLFRQLNVQDLAGYKRAGGAEPLPRSLLIIDEFQEFFVEEDRVSQGAAVLLDRIVRQGRAFGIHVLLGSQTLGGAYTLARATLGQMVIRIALQCNEADAYLIMDQDNPAPRLLSRPGEGIYNDAAGAIEGNSPFQAVWLPEPVRDQFLQVIQEHAAKEQRDYPPPFVFEGNAPALVQENARLESLLKTNPAQPPDAGRIWLGAPNSIKGPTEAAFHRQSGSNLLIVGQNEESSLTMIAVGLITLAAQFPTKSAKFLVLDPYPANSPERDFLDQILAGIPHEIVRSKGGDVSAAMTLVADELGRRGSEETGEARPEWFVIIAGMQHFKKLRQEDEFSFSTTDAASPAATLLTLITEGPSAGIHVIAACDTYTNVNRFLGRKNLSEFEMRVLFQMSASDSASLIDDPAASTLGLHRAVYYNDREGYLETFRPYARPGNDWIEETAARLRRA